MNINKSFIFFISLYLLSIILTMRFNSYFIQPDKDTGVFLYIGKLIAENKVPYKDSWDHKPPMIFFLNGMLFKFLPNESKTIAIFETFWIFLSVLVIFNFSSHIWNLKTSVLVVLLFTVYFSNISFPESYGMTETYQVLPAILTIYFLFLHSNKNSWFYVFLSGVFAVLSFLFKQTGMSVFLPALFYIFTKENIVFNLIVFFCGSLSLLIVILLYFFINNGLSDFFSQVFIYNFYYITLLKEPFLVNITNSFIFKRPILLYLSTGSLFLFLINTFLKKSYIQNKKLFIILLIWLLSDMFFISLSKRFYNHYFVQVIPVMVLLSGFLFDFIIKNCKIYILIVLIIMIFIISGATSHLEYNLRYILKNKNYINKFLFNFSVPLDNNEIISWILNNTDKKDKIYFWGTETRLNFITKRDCPSKYSYIYPLINYKYAKKNDFDKFLNDLKTNKPKYIIDSIGFFSNNIDFQQLNKFMSHLSSFGYDNCLSVDFYKIINFIDENYISFGFLGSWKIFKLKK